MQPQEEGEEDSAEYYINSNTGEACWELPAHDQALARQAQAGLSNPSEVQLIGHARNNM
eukprot:COSAG05_NODE_86_length_20511_cov_71.945277_9_plen_59_part_00